MKKEAHYTIEDINALPDGQRAELINGKIYMMMPPKRMHQKLSMEISTIINVDPGKRRVNKYVFSPEFWDEVYSFEDDIPVGICEGFNMNLRAMGF